MAAFEACQEPRQLDLAALRREFKHFAEGVHALAEELSYSDDQDEVRLFLATVAEFRDGLYDAEIPAVVRDQDLEIWHRYNRVSWTRDS